MIAQGNDRARPQSAHHAPCRTGLHLLPRRASELAPTSRLVRRFSICAPASQHSRASVPAVLQKHCTSLPDGQHFRASVLAAFICRPYLARPSVQTPPPSPYTSVSATASLLFLPGAYQSRSFRSEEQGTPSQVAADAQDEFIV